MIGAVVYPRCLHGYLCVSTSLDKSSDLSEYLLLLLYCWYITY